MIHEIWNRSYHQRIQDLDLLSLAQRRLRGQAIEVAKLMDSALPVHEGFLIMTLMTEQDTM